MFDANASHIKCGQKFFAEIHAVDEQLESAGINVGDIVLCEHVKKDDEFPRNNLVSMVWTDNKESNPIEWVFDNRSEGWAWMAYSGRPNGKGFISDKWREKALDFIGGEWESES